MVTFISKLHSKLLKRGIWTFQKVRVLTRYVPHARARVLVRFTLTGPFTWRTYSDQINGLGRLYYDS